MYIKRWDIQIYGGGMLARYTDEPEASDADAVKKNMMQYHLKALLLYVLFKASSSVCIEWMEEHDAIEPERN
ncbi:hypothetical protein [Lysinibacillus sp. G4S2]|uniref:hypothetical protein n=1 Tax=Lysinibacillus sp. G4S2 TaxID=3055859 RepID=UPI0025A1D316|nr:hypothetical protein [Lysinibacillus sp. G4S2]MDM5249635.1 hypothetical protein [Lysinibacillus sp. G4S2]